MTNCYSSRIYLSFSFFSVVPKGEIVVSSIVLVRSEDNIYRKGFVSSKTYSKFQVRIYGESEVQTLDINDSAAVVLDVTPDPTALKIGTTVIASFDGFSWEAGNIAEIRHLKETENEIYRVRFISGGDTWVFSLNRIRILKTRNPKGMTFYVKKYLRCILIVSLAWRSPSLFKELCH